MTQALLMVGCALGPPLIALIALVLRLRWQAARDKRRHDTLTTLASCLLTTGMIEIHFFHANDNCLQVRIAAGPEPIQEG